MIDVFVFEDVSGSSYDFVDRLKKKLIFFQKPEKTRAFILPLTGMRVAIGLTSIVGSIFLYTHENWCQITIHGKRAYLNCSKMDFTV